MVVPQAVAGAGPCRADVGVAVVAVDPPGLQHPLDVALVARPADVVHHPILRPGLQRGPNLRCDLVQRLVPVYPLPAALASLTDPLQGVEYAFRVVDLVDRGGPLGTGPATAPWMVGITLELSDLLRLLVNVGQHTASRLAVEAGCRHQRVPPLDALGPLVGVEFDVVVPVPWVRELAKVSGLG